MTAITGNTYPVKDAIKALGGKWNPDAKAWMVPDAKADEARKLVAGAPKQNSYTAHSTNRRGRCSHCGGDCNPRFRTCVDCAHGGQSYIDSRGNFVLGSDD